MNSKPQIPKCCGKKVEYEVSNNIITLKCLVCGKSADGSNAHMATVNFNSTTNPGSLRVKKENPERANMQLAALPRNSGELATWAQANIGELMNSSASFIDAPATRRMIDKNIRYVLNTDLKNAWSDKDGIQSIISALKESFWHGAILPDMGSIIPFKVPKVDNKYVAEFIPALSAFSFALTTGKNAIFEWIETIPIHENDIRDELQIKDGELKISITPGIPRGELIAIAVRGKEKARGKVIGEVYDVERLMEKAKAHSKSYQSYLKNLAEYNTKKSEGQNVGDFWKTNPYDGPDKVEMLKKVAGKTFFRPYMKIVNSVNMVNEFENKQDIDEAKIIDNVISVAKQQVNQEPDPEPGIQDADFRNEPESDGQSLPGIE